MVGSGLFGARRRGLRVFVVGALAWGVVGTQAPAAAEEPPPGVEVPEWVTELLGGSGSGRELPLPDLDAEPWSAEVPDSDSVPGEPAVAVDVPAAGVWEVELGGEGERAAPVDGAAPPVDVTSAAGGLSGAALEVEVFDGQVAERLGVSVFAFEIGDPGGGAIEVPADDEGASAEGESEPEPGAETGTDAGDGEDAGGEDPGAEDGDGDASVGDGGSEGSTEGAESDEEEPAEDEADEEPAEDEGSEEADGESEGSEAEGDAPAPDVGDAGASVSAAPVAGPEASLAAAPVQDAGEGLLADSAAAEAAVPVELAIGYADFAELYGAGFTDRLQVRVLPACVREVPVPDGCDVVGEVLPARHDRGADELIVEVEDLAGLAVEGPAPVDPGVDIPEGEAEALAEEFRDLGPDDDFAEFEAAPEPEASAATAEGDGSSGVVFALTAGVDGDTGTYAATDLPQSGSWQTSTGSGEFSHMYEIPTPEGPAGSSPQVGVAYSSGSVDGRTNAGNPDTGRMGLGFSEFGGGYIERSYESCRLVNLHGGGEVDSDDLCWDNHNAQVSMDGMVGQLRPLDDDGNEWAAFNDEGWEIDRLTGADNGTHDGEHWRATAPDGTEYWFGLGENPDNGNVTDSALQVPVISSREGEPCYDESEFHQCDMAWRWNLDRVVDPDGNVTTYTYRREGNRYAARNGWDIFNGTAYHKSARLLYIDYGSREGEDVQPTARVNFAAEYRCLALDSSCSGTPPRAHNGTEFPDVPNDLICVNDACTATAPSFFSWTRYSHAQTQVRVGSEWRTVEQYNFGHVFGGAVYGGPEYRRMHLTSIRQSGLAEGGWIAMEPTVFNYEWMPNRSDVTQDPDADDVELAMWHARVNRITNPYGGVTEITYGQNRPCAEDYNPAPDWDENDRDCFPQTVFDGGHQQSGIFNRYLVTSVSEDPGDGGPVMTTGYEYEGDPAWLFDYRTLGLGTELRWGWRLWRGYGTMTTTQGESVTRTRVFRGLDGGRNRVDAGSGWGDLERRDVDITPLSVGDPVPDHPSLAGMVLESQEIGELDGEPDQVLSSQIHTYEHRVTHEYTDEDDRTREPQWTGLAEVTERVPVPHSESGEFRERTTHLGYNENLQQDVILEAGWEDDPDDQRCTVISYAENAAENMVAYPASTMLSAGDFAFTPPDPDAEEPAWLEPAACDGGELLSESQTLYDDSSTLGELGSQGRPTTERVRVDGDTWSETTTEFDGLGRPISVTDANGNTSTTTYSATPSHAIPTETVETNAAGHEVSTTWLPEWGQPVETVDANGNVTTMRYDALGRLQSVWAPDVEKTSENTYPSVHFEYDPEQRAVTTISLVEGDPNAAEPELSYDWSWAIHDGFGRNRQAQAYSPVDGMIVVSEQVYDGSGNVAETTEAQAVTANPGAYVGGIAWDNTTRTSYDGQSRPTGQQWLQGADVVRETSFDYGAYTTLTTDAEGNRTREVLDGHGRLVEVGEKTGDGDWVTSTYTYDLADRLLSATDPAGNTINYEHNLAGWRTAEDDPNRGTTAYSYNAAGQVVTTTDGEGNVLWTDYDELGRQVERRADGPEGNLLASWAYDSASGGIGAPHTETRHTAEGDWVSSVDGYDAMGRPAGTTLTVPSSVAGLAGDYTFTQSYDRAGRVVEATYPAIGDLGAETITTTYDSLGLAQDMTGDDAYVRSMSYDDRGRPVASGHGSLYEGAPWLARNWTYDADQRLSGTEVWTATGGVVAAEDLTFDDAGNLVDRVTEQNGQSWRECFGYDARYRLTDAHTVDAADTCADGTPGTGDNPYEHSYTYADDGRLLGMTEDGEGTLYGYPASGEQRPHAPTGTATTEATASYSWDDNGNLVERTADGVTETFDWDIEARLASVSDGTNETGFTYDAGGQRLLRQTGDTATLYVGGHEVTATAGTITDVVRPYSFAGELVATRTYAGLQFLVSDGAGSVTAAIEPDAEVTGSRTYDPYGNVRSEDGDDLPTERGFVGQVEDPTTELSYMNQRYYDTSIGLFISTDPILDINNQRTLNPYSYAGGNPTTLSDPSGLSPAYIYQLESANQDLQGQVSFLGAVTRWQSAKIRNLELGLWDMALQRNFLLRVSRWQAATIHNLKIDLWDMALQRNFLLKVSNWQAAVIDNQQRTIWNQAATINRLNATVGRLQQQVNYLTWYRSRAARGAGGGGGNPKGGSSSGGYSASGSAFAGFSATGSVSLSPDFGLIHGTSGISWEGTAQISAGNANGLAHWFGCQWGSVSAQFQGRSGGCDHVVDAARTDLASACEATSDWRTGAAVGSLFGGWAVPRVATAAVAKALSRGLGHVGAAITIFDGVCLLNRRLPGR